MRKAVSHAVYSKSDTFHNSSCGRHATSTFKAQIQRLRSRVKRYATEIRLSATIKAIVRTYHPTLKSHQLTMGIPIVVDCDPLTLEAFRVIGFLLPKVPFNRIRRYFRCGTVRHTSACTGRDYLHYKKVVSRNMRLSLG